MTKRERDYQPWQTTLRGLRERERERERVRVQGEKQRVFLDSGPRVIGKRNYTKEMFLK